MIQRFNLFRCVRKLIMNVERKFRIFCFVFLAADFIGPISAWCVTDHSELTILFACDSKLSICAVGSSVYRSVSKKNEDETNLLLICVLV